MEIRRFTRLSMLLALSVVLNIIESFIPFFNGVIPGFKIGLANIIIMFVLYCFSFKDALTLSMLRVILVGILRTGLFSVTFFFSLSGAIISVIVMYLAKRFTKLSVVGVSILGSISHSIGQILVAMVLVKNVNIVYYLPWILLFAVPSGILVGFICKEMMKNFKEEYIEK